MGDPSVDVSEEMRDKAQQYKKKGIDALSEGKVQLMSWECESINIYMSAM